MVHRESACDSDGATVCDDVNGATVYDDDDDGAAVCDDVGNMTSARAEVFASNILLRISAPILTNEEVAQRKETRADTLNALSSTSATKRKFQLLKEGCANDVVPEASFFIVYKSLLNELLSAASCNRCGETPVRVETGLCLGLATKMELLCDNCGVISKRGSSSRCAGTQQVNPFEVNIRSVRAVQSVGKKHGMLNDIFSHMDVSHRGLHHKSYGRLHHRYSHPATASAAIAIESQSAQKVHEIYKELGGAPNNIDVIYDGTWMTRGHTSHIGVGCVIELYSGLVLDHCVLSNYCHGCSVGPKPGDSIYSEWHEKHRPQCQKNTEANAGQMEIIAAKTMFQRSLQKHQLRYTNVLCDGDSRTYTALSEDRVYGFIPIQKQECVNHVKKRMGTALCNLVEKNKSKDRELSMSGKGRLTQGLIKKLTNYYGWAIKSNPSDVPAMEKAIMATFYHVTSTDNEPHHEHCPTGVNSWCKFNSAAASGQPAPAHKLQLPAHVRAALLPIYKRLPERELLERCQQGKTQNAIESLNNLIWSLQSKSQFASLTSVESTVADAVCRFNAGCERALQTITSQLGYSPGSCSLRQAAEKDARRIKKATKVHETVAKKRKTTSRCKENVSSHAKDYIPGGF